MSKGGTGRGGAGRGGAGGDEDDTPVPELVAFIPASDAPTRPPSFGASLRAFRCRHGGPFLRAHGGEAGEAFVFHGAKPLWVLALK